MKLPVLIIGLAIFSQPLLVQAAGNGKGFEKQKARVLQNIETKIGFFNSFKSCVSGATSKEQLKSCRQNHKSQMQAHHKNNKDERAARKQEREARKAAKKNKN
jgi:hypothetical protein